MAAIGSAIGYWFLPWYLANDKNDTNNKAPEPEPDPDPEPDPEPDPDADDLMAIEAQVSSLASGLDADFDEDADDNEIFQPSNITDKAAPAILALTKDDQLMSRKKANSINIANMLYAAPSGDTSNSDETDEIKAVESSRAIQKKSSRASLIASTAGSWLGWTRRDSVVDAYPAFCVTPPYPIIDSSESIVAENARIKSSSPRLARLLQYERSQDYIAGVLESNVRTDINYERNDGPVVGIAENMVILNILQKAETENPSLLKQPQSLLPDLSNSESLSNHKGDKNIPCRATSSVWNFWAGDTTGKAKSTSDLPNKNNFPGDISNTILNIAPSLLPRTILVNSESVVGDVTKESRSLGDLDPSRKNDAVLYKAHSQATEFEKINTHRNQDIRENVLVPAWNDCLPLSHSTRFFGIFQLYSTCSSSACPKDCLSLSGLLSRALEWLRVISPKTLIDLENEYSRMRAMPHDLFGLRLEILPPNKRACLPNYEKYFSIGSSKLKRGQKSPGVNSNSRTINITPGPLTKIRKMLIIGVHGFFPHRVIRPLIGPPQGTSSKFASEAEKAALRYCQENNLLYNDESNVCIQKIALEKEGEIFDRVDFFTTIMSRWQLELNSADFIFVASHSQGCVVAIILIARLICLGILQRPAQKRIGILGMAGINNGPFYGVEKSFLMKAYLAIENAALLELFEFTNFDSKQSLVYKQSVQIAINFNVKICFVASINDQMVPLYLALATHLFHPNIFRACYIDHSSQTSGYIQQLVSHCCYLQNMGYSDHGVLRELSSALAGPLTGSGHSKIYNDGKVYDLGLRFFLDTSDIIIPVMQSILDLLNENELLKSIEIKAGKISSPHDHHLQQANQDRFHFLQPLNIPWTNRVYAKEYDIGKIGSNVCILPWCVRGLILSIEKYRKYGKQDEPIASQIFEKEVFVSKRHFDSSPSDVEKSHPDTLWLEQLYEEWNPRTKPLKDLKQRLHGMRHNKL